MEAETQEDENRHLFALADLCRQCGNDVTGMLVKNYEQMVRTKAYRALLKDYAWHKEHMKDLDKDGERYALLDAELKEISSQMEKMQKKFRVTLEDAQHRAADFANEKNLNSVFALSRADDIWKGMEDVLYRNGEHLHFRRRGDLPLIRGRQIERAITVHIDKKTGGLVFYIAEIGKFRVKIPEKDYFLQDEYAAIVDYLKHPEQEAFSVQHMDRTGEVMPVFRPCYAAIQCREIRGKLRVFVQLTIAAPALPKVDRYGNRRNLLGRGPVGVDLGPQSCASVSNTDVELFNLAERNGRCTKSHEKRKVFLRRAMDRSRKANNPNRFNKDGTYKKGSNGKWVCTRRYIKMRDELRDMERRDRESRLYAVREDANRLRAQGDVCIIEPRNAKKLQKRAQKTTYQEKETAIVTKKGETKIVHKANRKKRHGKSILHRCPGQFQSELHRKFGDGYHEVPSNYRASQYDHMLDEYIKKKLSERWHFIKDKGGNILYQIQRDIYSAFLLFCADDGYDHIDRERCIQRFDRFWLMHQETICRIVTHNLEVCNSGLPKPRKTLSNKQKPA